MLQTRNIAPSEYRDMPWRNGMGSTAQIAIEPETADIARDPFLWRVSLAQVDASCPFSSFPGYDRILLILEGRGLRLTQQSGGARELGLMTPYVFRGEEEVFAELKEGPVRDFNVMVLRERVRAEVTLLAIPATAVPVPLSLDITLVHLIEGDARVVLRNDCGQGLPAQETSHVIELGHTFRVDRARGDRSEVSLHVQGPGRAVVTQFFHLK